MFQDQLREVVAHVKRVQQKQQELMGKVQQIADSVAEQQRALEAQQEVFEVSIRSYARMYIYSTYVLYCMTCTYILHSCSHKLHAQLHTFGSMDKSVFKNHAYIN